MAEPKPLMYGVWIENEGWLRFKTSVFADQSKEMANAAREMLHNKYASVQLIDAAMIDLQEMFIMAERTYNRSFMGKVRRWLHGILG